MSRELAKMNLISVVQQLPKEDIETIQGYVEMIEEENQSLKKQLEELEEENFNLRENIYINKMSFPSEGRNIKELIEMPTYEDLLNKQKEFIKYLEDEIKRLKENDIYQPLQKMALATHEHTLQKYKEIIGDDKK